MSHRGRELVVSIRDPRSLAIATALLSAIALSLAVATPARGNEGYELSKTTPTLQTEIEFPHGIAVDQATRRVYVAAVSPDVSQLVPGSIFRFESDGTPAGSFGGGAETIFSGVAVNPVTQQIYGAEVRDESPFGTFGTARMTLFSPTGVGGTPWALTPSETYPQIATDSSGDVYYPNATSGSVQVYDSAGVLQETIVCTGCPGGAFGDPVSVALDSGDDLYVVDLTPDRVIKFTKSGGSYGFDSVFQTDKGAAGVGVDPTTDDVFVSDLPNGINHHIVAYDSSGVQFDDFGAGVVTPPHPTLGRLAASQLAVDTTTNNLYVGEGYKLFIFERVIISPPSVTTSAASSIVQQGATLNAIVNAKGHAVLDCGFEYVDNAEYLANGFANALEIPCSKAPDGSKDVALTGVLAGLTPGTQYRYRAVAESNAGPTIGNERTLTTLAGVPPTVTPTAASAVTQTGATLNATVNPHGGTVTDCHFEFGASASYGSSVPCAFAVGTVTVNVAQSAVLTGLSANSSYHFRLVVTSNAGTTEGGDTAFTTSAVPPPQPPPPGPEPEPEADPDPPQRNPQPSCKPGFVKKWVGGKATCVKRCRKGTIRRKVQGKYKCLKSTRPHRADRRRPARAGRR